MCRRFFLLSGIIFAAMFFLNDACYAGSSCSGCQGCACGGRSGTTCTFAETNSTSIKIDHLPYENSVTVDVGCRGVKIAPISIDKIPINVQFFETSVDIKSIPVTITGKYSKFHCVSCGGCHPCPPPDPDPPSSS